MKNKSVFSFFYLTIVWFIFLFILQIKALDTIKNIFNSSISRVKKGYNWVRGTKSSDLEDSEKNVKKKFANIIIEKKKKKLENKIDDEFSFSNLKEIDNKENKEENGISDFFSNLQKNLKRINDRQDNTENLEKIQKIIENKKNHKKIIDMHIEKLRKEGDLSDSKLINIKNELYLKSENGQLENQFKNLKNSFNNNKKNNIQKIIKSFKKKNEDNDFYKEEKEFNNEIKIEEPISSLSILDNKETLKEQNNNLDNASKEIIKINNNEVPLKNIENKDNIEEKAEEAKNKFELDMSALNYEFKVDEEKEKRKIDNALSISKIDNEEGISQIENNNNKIPELEKIKLEE